MLTAAEILANHSEPSAFKRRLVFMALAGEAWGNMGSKRLLWEMSQKENSTQGLQLSAIDQVLLRCFVECLKLPCNNFSNVQGQILACLFGSSMTYRYCMMCCAFWKTCKSQTLPAPSYI